MSDEGVIIDQWVQEVKDTKILTVFPTPRLVRSRWGPIFTTAINTFNLLSELHKLGVTLKKADQPPDSEGFKDGGANIQFDFSGGDTSFKFRNKVRPPDEPFSAVLLHGLTRTVTGGGRMVKCFIFVPMFPLANDDREVGDSVKEFIAVHELIHAAGCLNNSDHSTEATPDVFCGPPRSLPQLILGATAAQDKLELKAGTQTSSGFIRGVDAPPIKLSTRTAGEIRKRWN